MYGVPEHYIAEAPWRGRTQPRVTAPPYKISFTYSDRDLCGEITRIDELLQAGKIDLALASLSSLRQELQYLHNNRNFNIEGIKREQRDMCLSVANFLWGWASHAKEYGHGRMDGPRPERPALPIYSPTPTLPEVFSVLSEDEDEIIDVVPFEGSPSAGDQAETSSDGFYFEEYEEGEGEEGEEPQSPASIYSKGESTSSDEVHEAENNMSPREIVPFVDPRLPHFQLWEAVSLGSTDKVIVLLLDYRFSLMQLMEALHLALSSGCSSKMYNLLERYCGTYINAWHSNVSLGLHLCFPDSCPFFTAIEGHQYAKDILELAAGKGRDGKPKLKVKESNLEDYASVVEQHVGKWPKLLLEAKSSRGEPLLVTALRCEVPWKLMKAFIPEPLPHDWFYNFDITHSFGDDNMSRDEFLTALEAAVPEDDPFSSQVEQARALTKTAEEIDAELLDQAALFPSYVMGLFDSVEQGCMEDTVYNLGLVLKLLKYEKAKPAIDQQGYSTADIGRQLWESMKNTPTAELFLKIITICKEGGLDLLCFHVPGGDSSETPLLLPAYLKPGLLDELLAVGNVSLILDLLACEDGDDSEDYSVCSDPFVSLVACPHTTSDLLKEFILFCKEIDRLDLVDAPLAENMYPLGTALKVGRMDLVRELLPYSDVLFVWGDNDSYLSLLSYFLSEISSHLSRDQVIDAAKELIDQAKRVFQNSHLDQSKRFPSLGFYMDSPSKDEATPLQMAYVMHDDGLMEYILAAGASPFATILGPSGTTTLCHTFIKENNLDELIRLLQMTKEANPSSEIPGMDSSVDRNDQTALDLACSTGNMEAVKILLKFGASMLPFNSSSVFIRALKMRKTSPGRETDVLVKTLFSGWSAKHTAALLSPEAEEHHAILMSFMKSQSGVVIKRYMKDAVDRAIVMQGAVDGLRYSPDLFELVLQLRPKKRTAGVKLHSAVEFLTIEQLRLILKAGIDVDTLNDEGITVHFKLVQAANIPMLTVLLDARPMDLTKERDPEGNSLLHWSVLKTPADIRDGVIEFLVEREPNLMFTVNSENKLAREFAISKRIKKKLLAFEEEHNRKTAGRLSKKGGDYSYTISSQPGKNEKDIGDLTVLGPLDEPEQNKRRRLLAMIEKLPTALEESSSAVENGLVVNGGAADGVAQDGAGGRNAQTAAVASTFGSIVNAAADATLPDVAAVEVYDSGDEYEDTTIEELEDPLSVVAAAAGAAAGGELGAALQGLPWELIVTREAYLEWGGMDSSYRQMVLLKLREIGQGRWESMGACKRRMRDVPPELNLWRCKFTKAGRIVFDIAQDYSSSKKTYTDLIRIWAITLSHDKYMREVDKVIQSFAKSHRVTAALRLTPIDGSTNTGAGPREHKSEQKLPRVYYRQGGDGDEMQQAEAAQAAKQQQSVLQYPPATSGQGSYTLLKFFDLTTELARAILEGMAGAIEAPFRVSAEETRIITTNPGRSIILAGRSGTGKTTCACFKLFARWLTAWRVGDPHNQVFVTASGTLRREVARSFAKMRRAVVDPEVADELEALAERPLVTLKDVPAQAFPLFLSQKTYLEALDGTLAVPFFPRREDGSIMWERGGDASDPDGMSQEIDLSPDSDYEDYDSEDDDSDDEELVFEDAAIDDEKAVGGTGAAKLRRWHRQEIGFTEFQAKWSQFAPHDLRKGNRIPPALVWTDLVSYIKGSAEAVRSATGHLTLEQYLEIGRKRAPNFDPELRADVYRVFEGYEKYKKAHSRYDTADLVGHISRRLTEEGGYSGVDISAIFRDEVQDFMQGELLLDLRVSSNPNELFLSGDSAQTIARGLGFRFTDIQTLFYEEGSNALSAQKKAAVRLRARAPVAAAPFSAAAAAGAGGAVVKKGGGAPLEMPVIEHLTVNYRTHSGILDAAASTVELLRRYFPQHIDKMQREKAFFSGPPVLLVCGGGAQEIASLLSWSDKKASQVEFGAHQVVLVRDEEAKNNLPISLRGARPLTVPQSKGLEFDDVLLYNFFSDSMVKKEWRVLLNYLEELEKDESTAGRLLSVEEAEKGVGKLGHDALRPLENVDLTMIRPICDELKHLYTALTRAKNFVAIVDCDAEARAPFYYFLARLGLGTVITDVSGVDKTHLGLSKVASSPLEWAERGMKMIQSELLPEAAADFAKAGDTAMEQYCSALDTMNQAVEKAIDEPIVARKMYLTAGLQLMDLAINGRRPAELRAALKERGHPDYSRKSWARKACIALERCGERKMAASLRFSLGEHLAARQLLVDIGDAEGAAKCCVDVSKLMFAQGKETAAMSWSAEAFKQFKIAKQYKRCLEILESVPGLFDFLKRLPGATGNPAEEVAAQLLSSGDAEVAAAARKYAGDSQASRKGLSRSVNAANGAAGDAEAAKNLAGAKNASGGDEYNFESLDLLGDLEEEDLEYNAFDDDDDFTVNSSRRAKGRKKRTPGKTPRR